ncbi:MAG: HD domain-containing protein [Syntrophomonadaceae bacterium]|nr:HD domain-containing protein [Syntrophomonadaceae bacterium]
MESKQIVLTGLVATALITALVLSGLVVDMVVAFLVLAAGILLTYYIALNQKRIEQYDCLRGAIKAGNDIREQDNLKSVLDHLAVHARLLLGIEHTLLWLPGDNITWPEEKNYSDFLEEIGQRMRLNPVTIQLTRSEDSNLPWPEEVNWLAAYPLVTEEEFRGILLLLNSRSDKMQGHTNEVLNNLCRHSANAIKGLLAEQSEQEDEEVLINSILAGIEAGDPIFRGHSARVDAIAILIGSKLGLDKQEMKTLHYAALLHDIGKYAETMLDKEDDELLVSDHASLGAELIPATGIFEQVREAVKYHHERYDGSGYPQGLRQTDIPFLARIIAVADVYDAVTRMCSEEERLDPQTALGVIKKATGTIFDPLVVVALEEVAEEVANLGAIQDLVQDEGEGE